MSINGIGAGYPAWKNTEKAQKNRSVLFSEDTYKAVFDWLQNNRGRIEEMQKFAMWQDVFQSIDLHRIGES